MCWWFYLVIVTMDYNEAQSSMVGGVNFLNDPFLDAGSGAISPAVQKSNKPDSSCVSNGALAGSIIGTLLLSALIAFLTWLVYIRPKFQELYYKQMEWDSYRLEIGQQYQRSGRRISSILDQKQPHDRGEDDLSATQLPLDVTDYKFGTFPFRQPHASHTHNQYSRNDWLNRIRSSFHSVNMDQNSEMLDIELLDATFGGLNFSIAGNMRAGIFIKDILDRDSSDTYKSASRVNKIKTGDRIMALTVCFDSIVYEDALTILSYASPYPVILRVQRPASRTVVNVVKEKRPAAANTSSKVKWRDALEDYDNDSLLGHSISQQNTSTDCSRPIPIIIQPPIRSSSKKHGSDTGVSAARTAIKSSLTAIKGNKVKPSSDPTTKMSNADTKKYRSKPKVTLPSDVTMKSAVSTSRKAMKPTAGTVVSSRHEKSEGGVGGAKGHSKDATNDSEATTMPYYDSPYDYYYGQHMSQYQHLHQPQLNRNNNNSLSTETLTGVTPYSIRSVYTVQASSSQMSLPVACRCECCFSSATIASALVTYSTPRHLNAYENTIDNTDTFV